jgi:ankyrin repeat protein
LGGDDTGYRPIHAAVSYNHKDMVGYILEQGENLEVTDAEGDTALFYCETLDMAKYLVEELHADPRHVNNQGQSVLQVVYSNDCLQVAEYIAETTGQSLSDLEEQVDSDGVVQIIDAEDIDGIDRSDELRDILNNGSSKKRRTD